MTKIIDNFPISYRIKEASIRLNMEIEYAAELKRQKLLRQSKAK